MRMSCSACFRASWSASGRRAFAPLPHARARVQFLQRRHRPALVSRFSTCSGGPRNWRSGQVRDAQHLVGRGELLQPAADALGRAAADAGVHFVEDQRAVAVFSLPRGRFSAPARCARSRRRRRPSRAAAAPRPGSGRPEIPRGPPRSPTTARARPRCGTRCAPWPGRPVRLPPASPTGARPACAGASRAAALRSRRPARPGLAQRVHALAGVFHRVDLRAHLVEEREHLLDGLSVLALELSRRPAGSRPPRAGRGWLPARER